VAGQRVGRRLASRGKDVWGSFGRGGGKWLIVTVLAAAIVVKADPLRIDQSRRGGCLPRCLAKTEDRR